ncbi:antA/AntB antirepressor family protein [Edaphovirga cremea]|uniref:antA/AntB antirepressor family protein n=1 Tax=Edaphovirga cremea TaxID=2267246 RepID=UPI003988AAFA
MTIKNTANIGRDQTHPQESHSDINGNDFATLVPVISGQIGERESNIVSAKALHKTLGVANDFSTWIKLRIDEYGFVLGTDYAVFDSSNCRNQSANIDQQETGWVSKRGGDRRSKDYVLSLGMAKELSMVERNEQGKVARRYFIDCEERLRLVAPEEHQAALLNWRKNRVAACEDHKSMADAMKGYIERTGDGQKGYAYSNESRFLNKLVLGIDPVKWAKDNGIPSKQVRDRMNADQLALLAYLESRDCALLDMDTLTVTRKARLTELAQRWLAKRLLEVSDAK